MSSLGTAMLSSVVNLAAADFQNEIGDIFANGANGGEGSLGHMLLHSGLGCVTSSITGGNCAAGAAAGFSQSVLSGYFEQSGSDLTNAEEQQIASMVGGLAGYLFSGGNAQNVNIAASVAQSGMKNNRQMHTAEAIALKKLMEGKSEEEQQRLKDAACFLINCAAGVPESDPNYEALLEMQTRGAAYSNEINELSSSTVDISRVTYTHGEEQTETINLFEYTQFDHADDWASSHQRIIDPVLGGVSATIGAGEVVGSTVAGIGLCASVVGCAAGAVVATVGITDGYNRSSEGVYEVFEGIIGNAPHVAGQQVLDSFEPDYAGPAYYTTDAAWNFAGDIIGLTVGAVGARLVRTIDSSTFVDVSRVDTPNTTNNLDLDNPNINGNGGNVDFYVSSDGIAVPATGYRAFGGEANFEEAMSGIISSRDPTYFTFDDITGLSPSEAQSFLQTPKIPSHVVQFDTAPLLDDIRIPDGNWNSNGIPEPITNTFPLFGSGGATQAITNSDIIVNPINISPLNGVNK